MSTFFKACTLPPDEPDITQSAVREFRVDGYIRTASLPYRQGRHDRQLAPL